MSQLYSREQVVALVHGLTEPRLTAYVDARIVRPVQDQFQEVDLSRLQLACDLAEVFDLDEDGVDLVVTLIDRLHGLEHDMDALMSALAEEPAETRARLCRVILRRG